MVVKSDGALNGAFFRRKERKCTEDTLMIAALVIVFREMLEMALVIGILLAATRGLAGSRRWIGVGIGGGLIGALIVAIFMEEMEASFNGSGEFMFNAIVLLLASGLIAWTVFWMTSHGRELSAKMKQVGASVKEGTLPYTALAVVSLSTVIREGSEAAFFLFGAAQTAQTDGWGAQTDGWGLMAGGVLGLVSALAIGAIVYAGMIRVPVRHLFSVAGWILMLIASGMASQAAMNLVTINWLPPLIDRLWDTSWLLPQSSLLGEVLHVLVGYDEGPSGIQFLVFVASLVTMALLYRRLQTKTHHDPRGTLRRHPA